jgi:hypothetical protein
MMMQQPDALLWEAFRDGGRFLTGSGPVVMQCHDLGVLVLPTGNILACDPILDLYTEPFDRRVPPGEYPVFLATEEGAGDVALAMVQFRRAEPVAWVATQPRELTLESAVAAVMDVKTARRVRRSITSGRSGRISRMISDAWEARSWANLPVDPDSGANLILFPALGDDATYSCYWGLSRSGRLACLVLECFFSPDVAVMS